MKPTAVNDRIDILDIARGLAIFGILLVNMEFFHTSLQAIQFQVEQWPDFWNQAAGKLVELLAAGKFIAIFSFLFGYGMIIFQERAVQKGRRFGALYSRRLLALLLFGLIHGLFIWYGDILVHYALLGFILLLFRKCRPKTLLVWSLMMLMLVPGLLLLSGSEASTPELSPEFQQRVDEWIEQDQIIYGSGSYGDILQQRISDWIASFANQIVFYPQILGLFLMGAYFARRKLLHDVSGNRAALVKVCLWTGVTGLGLSFLPGLLPLLAGSAAAGMGNTLELLRALLGFPLTGLFYITVLALFAGNNASKRVLQPLANTGRMAFTNYIMQSAAGTLIFYGYGLGWFGKVGPLFGSLIALLIFILQIVFSTLWLRRFQIGPLEWLWRTITYFSFSPIRKNRLGSER
ncbi:uncharacterized protein SAMN05421736_101169 [Evansella caseinilytica]|uniref:DUF418 domain-containing protein n=1 Tax=Evansella caseinilytica TaxID=1503961 RepID=A0A1H3GH25_9BACI|nr:DUF418 domain-containing protein [Evansella caseinilytica]SDY02591.1 uncharacterized protein SAMN05421736_101169 [Evansella caseinilytica]